MCGLRRSTGATLEERVEDYYFFLSYARGDDDVFIQQFFRDLSSEVRSHAGLRADKEVGFLDIHSIELGAAWNPRLSAALATCRAFVALCSPRYFVSEFCGKEWTVFAERLHEYERSNGLQPPALLPLHWTPQRWTPEVAAARQYNNDNLPMAYGRNGLRQLMRLQRHRDSYLEFVPELARQIVETAETHPLPHLRGIPDINAVANAFERTGQPNPSSNHGGNAADAHRSDYVHFVVAAPSAADLDSAQGLAERTRREYYGEQPEDWAPYHPALPAPLAQFAVDIAQRRSFASAVTDVSRLGNRVELAEQRNQIVVLLLDVWATRLQAQRWELGEGSDRDRGTGQPTTAVMVPSNPEDAETQAHWPQFEQAVRAIFANRAVQGGDVMFRPSILTHLAFDADLQVLLEVTRNRVFTSGQPRRLPPDPPTQLPFLQGP
jgi:FxsC-like protein